MASFYLLKGKKSGQTIQDVTYFSLHQYFSIYPKLTKEEYEEELSKLYEYSWIEQQDTLIRVSDKGEAQLKGYKNPLFNGWLLRGNEKVFWGRLELVMQTLSHFKNNESRFIPNQKDYFVHQFVKSYLRERDYKSDKFQQSFKSQLEHLLLHPSLGDIHRTLLIYRLSGYQISGLTWDQLATVYESSVTDMKLQFVEALHIILTNVNEVDHPDLTQLAQDIFVHNPLTQSALKTEQLLTQGYSLQEIASIRSLKVNTIEDHLIEIASANKGMSLSTFISEEDIQRVLMISTKNKTKKLKIIRDSLPELSYFQIRLALALERSV
ncbi:helix-turn-helix domain-containing protein [Psychrobacillus sp. MER TA 171]|uniref:helix-turn-helix domain-containing protein n=1 Tax=Psychrobacillus sp. MER TA 171 TaxID=2939577 RepID=UPI00203EDF2B|nr:helix-turn-helix domain-containing protein [Psychrobacillus sp. MER TA 171]MCM3358831.1 helix-turn-helix domain-containing protein [Psychrobacillus sp. MER TA 171]